MPRLQRSTFAWLAALSCAGGCWPTHPPPDGSCAVVPGSTLDCSVTGYQKDMPLDVGLVAYACTGSARPDYDETIVDGVPQGLLCGDKGEVGSGQQGYCCTDDITPCAYDPKADCAAGESGLPVLEQQSTRVAEPVVVVWQRHERARSDQLLLHR